MLADDQAGELVWMKGMPHEEDGCSGYKPPVGVIPYVSSRGRSRHSHAMQRFPIIPVMAVVLILLSICYHPA